MAEPLGDGRNYTLTWGDNAQLRDWVAMEVVQTAPEIGLMRVIEEPIHMLFNSASNAREKTEGRQKRS
ncbi:MAG: hypothetical protein M1830_006591, partial [Pleopsidium flavum]